MNANTLITRAETAHAAGDFETCAQALEEYANWRALADEASPEHDARFEELFSSILSTLAA